MENQNNIREVTAPLELEQIKEYFADKSIVFLVDYQKSELKGPTFLTYLSNLDLPAEIKMQDSDYQQKEEILLCYMTTRSVYRTECLLYNIMYLLLKMRGTDTTNIILNPIFSSKEAEQFIKNHRDLLETWELFIESTTLYAQTCVEDLMDSETIKNNFEEVQDQEAIGSNVVNLFGLPAFMELFFSTPLKHTPKYFTCQFEDYMFRGKNLYSYYAVEENRVFKMFLAHIEGMIDVKAIAREVEKL